MTRLIAADPLLDLLRSARKERSHDLQVDMLTNADALHIASATGYIAAFDHVIEEVEYRAEKAVGVA